MYRQYVQQDEERCLLFWEPALGGDWNHMQPREPLCPETKKFCKHKKKLFRRKCNCLFGWKLKKLFGFPSLLATFHNCRFEKKIKLFWIWNMVMECMGFGCSGSLSPPSPLDNGAHSEPGNPLWDASDGNVLNCTWERFYLKKKSLELALGTP